MRPTARSYPPLVAMLSVAVLMLVLTGGATARPASAPVSTPAGANWMTYGGNLYNQRYSALAQINTGNVHRLKAAWTFQTGTFSDATSFESSPLVVHGVLYLTGPHSQVYALDARTGTELWSYVPLYADLNGVPLCCGQDNRGVAVGAGKVFVGQLDARLTALDQKTGDVVWSVPVGDPRQGYSETMAPLYYNGRVYIGVSGGEYEIRGYVSAYDAASGTLLWRFHTIPGPGAVGHNTWPAGSAIWRHGGAPSWQTPALDPALGLLYITAGNTSPDLDGHVRPGNNLFANSIVALDANTGRLRWYFQEVHHDIWDWDATSPNVLFDATVNGKLVHGLAEAGKTGWVYLLNRATGRPLVPIVEKAVPQNAWQHTAPTQPFVAGDPFVPHTCPQRIGHFPMGGIFTPFDRRQAMQICPGGNGGSEWSPAAYSPQTGFDYVCGLHEPQVYAAEPATLEHDTLRLGSIFVNVPGGRMWGTLTAMNARTDRISWQQRLAQPCIGGSLATAGGLVFSGEGNGNFDAYNARTGQRLWRFQTGAGVNAPAVSYAVDGVQFVAVASGGSEQLDYPRGDTLWVFALTGTMSPAPAPPAPPSRVPPGTVTTDHVMITSDGFAPMMIVVPPGTTVTWTNDTSSRQTTTSEKGVWNSGLLRPGQSFRFRFTRPGSYDYVSTTHPFMTGTVVVDRNAPQPSRAGMSAMAPLRQGPRSGRIRGAKPVASASCMPRSTSAQPESAPHPGDCAHGDRTLQLGVRHGPVLGVARG